MYQSGDQNSSAQKNNQQNGCLPSFLAGQYATSYGGSGQSQKEGDKGTSGQKPGGFSASGMPAGMMPGMQGMPMSN